MNVQALVAVFTTGDELKNPTGYAEVVTGRTTLTGMVLLIGNLLKSVMTIGGLLLLLYLIYGAIKYMTAAGNDKMVAEAQETINNALIGLMIMVGSYFIIRIAEVILGINIFLPTFFGP